jgi:Subunit ChlI of Mg-chelatase
MREKRQARKSFQMVTRVSTVAFEGIEARQVDVQVQIAAGNVAFILVGLPDKAVAESRERVRAALTASGLALPSKRVTINLAPADLPKEVAALTYSELLFRCGCKPCKKFAAGRL